MMHRTFQGTLAKVSQSTEAQGVYVMVVKPFDRSASLGRDGITATALPEFLRALGAEAARQGIKPSQVLAEGWTVDLPERKRGPRPTGLVDADALVAGAVEPEPKAKGSPKA